MHADDDNVVAAEHSIEFYMAMHKAGVGGQLHVFEKGGHGFGLGQTSGSLNSWPAFVKAGWRKSHGVRSKSNGIQFIEN